MGNNLYCRSRSRGRGLRGIVLLLVAGFLLVTKTEGRRVVKNTGVSQKNPPKETPVKEPPVVSQTEGREDAEDALEETSPPPERMPSSLSAVAGKRPKSSKRPGSRSSLNETETSQSNSTLPSGEVPAKEGEECGGEDSEPCQKEVGTVAPASYYPPYYPSYYRPAPYNYLSWRHRPRPAASASTTVAQNSYPRLQRAVGELTRGFLTGLGLKMEPGWEKLLLERVLRAALPKQFVPLLREFLKYRQQQVESV